MGNFQTVKNMHNNKIATNCNNFKIATNCNTQKTSHSTKHALKEKKIATNCIAGHVSPLLSVIGSFSLSVKAK